MYFDVQDAYDTLGYHCKHSEEERQNCECNFDDPFLPASFGSVLVDNDYVVMQFTGLLDKNGKEIYEGDILQIRQNQQWFSGKEIYEVSYKDGYFENFTGYKDSEIIGNIYESPELLSTNQGE